ncbi:SCO6880 family protein [Streptomyces sp. CA2R106]|uniref:SCO6880 family protein n=1 Tax=Streptomyces sp. CA2R106 TaxID=3120153 RepID=UPI00300BD6A6
MAAEQRTYVLGGETRRRSLFNGVSTTQLVGAGAFTVVWLLAVLATRSVVVLVGGILLGLGGWTLSRRRDAVGESWAGSLRDRAAFVTAQRRHGGAPEFVPGEALPAEVGEIRSLAYAPPGFENAPMAIIHHKNHKSGSWATGHLTATFEIQGAGDGLLPVRATNTAGLLFERLLGGLASAEIPVDQLDVATRVLPVHPAAYREHMGKLVVPSAPALLQRSMRELAGYAAGNTEEYRSFCTVRIPLAHLTASISGPTDLERVCEETFDVIGEVIRRVDAAGYTLRSVLGPRRLGALIRHLHDPDRDLEALDGIDTVADGWNYVRWNAKDHARIEGAARPWYHAVAQIPRDAWPAQAVNARWMEHLVTRVNPATIRTVQAQFRLVPKMRARDIARIGLTYDTATVRGAKKKGQVSTGETEASMTASRRVLHDLMQPVVAGTYPTVRVMVSAPDHDMLTAARRRIISAAEDGGVTRLSWADYRHGRALLTAFPMARGIKA